MILNKLMPDRCDDGDWRCVLGTYLKSSGGKQAGVVQPPLGVGQPGPPQLDPEMLAMMEQLMAKGK